LSLKPGGDQHCVALAAYALTKIRCKTPLDTGFLPNDVLEAGTPTWNARMPLP
jgi:hypothetical protein